MNMHIQDNKALSQYCISRNFNKKKIPFFSYLRNSLELILIASFYLKSQYRLNISLGINFHSPGSLAKIAEINA